MELNKCVLGYDFFGPRRALAMELAKCVLGASIRGSCQWSLIKCVLGYDFLGICVIHRKPSYLSVC